MPKSLLKAIELDLKNGYIIVKSKENWEAICSNVLLNIIQSHEFTNDYFKFTEEYVNSKSKKDILEEIKRHAYKAESILDIGVLARSAASGIVYNILENEKNMENQSLSQENVGVSIINSLLNKIDTINANDNFKNYIKSQIKEGTISSDELRRYNVITKEDIEEYSKYFQNHLENENYIK